MWLLSVRLCHSRGALAPFLWCVALSPRSSCQAVHRWHEDAPSGCDGYLSGLFMCRPIGVMETVDQGEKDDKIISVCIDDPEVKDLKDISEVCLPTRATFGHLQLFSRMIRGTS